MPFKSDAQRKFMFARHPKIAKRWAHKYGIPKNLPEHVGGGGKKPSRVYKTLAKHRGRI